MRYEEVHGDAVWGNWRHIVQKHVRQQAVTGGKRSVIDGWSVMESWEFLQSILLRSKEKMKDYPGTIYY